MALDSHSTFINLCNIMKSRSINLITSVEIQQCTELTSFRMIAARSLLSAFPQYSWLL